MPPIPHTESGRPRRRFEVILIGASTGGPQALTAILPALCAATPLPIVIVQHMPAGFTRSLAENLDGRCAHAVAEAAAGDLVRPQTCWIAPGGRHLLLTRRADGALALGLDDGPPAHSCRPAADVLFRSAAPVVGAGALALILTGMGKDGAAGLGVLKGAGATVLAQDKASSVVWGMPGAAVAAGVVDRVLPLRDLPAAVAGVLARGPRSSPIRR